jgi:hypothetical protein
MSDNFYDFEELMFIQHYAVIHAELRERLRECGLYDHLQEWDVIGRRQHMAVKWREPLDPMQANLLGLAGIRIFETVDAQKMVLALTMGEEVRFYHDEDGKMQRRAK